eukprot:360640-Chlamydomonas_euryale.AAC.3
MDRHMPVSVVISRRDKGLAATKLPHTPGHTRQATPAGLLSTVVASADGAATAYCARCNDAAAAHVPCDLESRCTP